MLSLYTRITLFDGIIAMLQGCVLLFLTGLFVVLLIIVTGLVKVFIKYLEEKL